MSKAGSTARRLNAEQKKRLWSQWRQGDSIAEIARSLGQYPASIRWILKTHGGISPPERQRSERALSLAERESISRGLARGQSLRQIARELERPASTISREVKRHGGREHYRAESADRRAWQNAQRQDYGRGTEVLAINLTDTQLAAFHRGLPMPGKAKDASPSRLFQNPTVSRTGEHCL